MSHTSRTHARRHAAESAMSRPPRHFHRPLAANGTPLAPSEYFGCNTLSFETMTRNLPANAVAALREHATSDQLIDLAVAGKVALAAKEWAISRGATHYCHWFQPQTGITAEKHDSFLSFDDNGRPIEHLSGKQLVQSEPDASSFPSGGTRSTSEARGYTAWDASSPMFLMETDNGLTLCIPSLFLSYHGEPLDEKTPLLRSLKALNKAAVKTLRLLGDTESRHVNVNCGPEQEYFAIDEAYFSLRPDLVLTGRTLLGAAPPKGQQLEDHYFGSIKPRILSYMMECELELVKLGVPCKTRHNEVAPCQFELAPIFEPANVAADHNQLVMEVFKSVAKRHHLTVLFHEKPFAGVNGSGKHVNWSLTDGRGVNMFEPGDKPQDNVRFLLFLAAALKSVHDHGALLRTSVASAGNDFRLGANEAPPAIMSVFLGDEISTVLDRLTGKGGADSGKTTKASKIDLDLARIPVIHRDSTDRNRTSPFAFTGNKFEFRAVGSSATISPSVTALNAAMTASLEAINERLAAHAGKDGRPSLEAILSVVREVAIEAAPVRFEGNNYGEEWHAEAARRGLPHLRNTPDALAAMKSDMARSALATTGILSTPEIEARRHVRVELYSNLRLIELETLHELASTHVLPSLMAAQQGLAKSINAVKVATSKTPRLQAERLDQTVALSERVLGETANLSAFMSHCKSLSGDAQAAAIGSKGMEIVAALRSACDSAEQIVDDDLWSLPKYREMLHLY